MIFYYVEPGVYNSFFNIVISDKDLENTFAHKSSFAMYEKVDSRIDRWYVIKQIFHSKNKVRIKKT